MKTKVLKILSVILSGVMLFSIFSVAVFADEAGVSVSFSAFDGTVIMPKQQLSVCDGIAEKYGYFAAEKDHNGVPVESITALDVLVAAHKEYYGDAFTAETAENYLVINKSQVILAFGKKAAGSSFAINDTGAHDDNFNDLWGAYTGYAIDEARICDGDRMSYFFYQDTWYYGDYYSWFVSDGNTVDSVKATAPAEMTFTLEGFCYGWYSCSKDEDKGIIALPGVDVYLVTGGEYTLVGQTDENGSITVAFPSKGDYKLCAYGTTEDDYSDDIPVVAAWCDVKVITKTQSVLERIRAFFKRILDAIRSLFTK